MKATGLTQSIAALVIALLAVGCTDGRRPKAFAREATQGAASLLNVAEVQYQSQPTAALQMQTANGALYLTGTPFAFSRWETAYDPVNPQLTFAASSFLTTFSPDPPFGGWVVSYYASKAMTILGSYALMSGTAGLSIISLASINYPQEVARFPMLSPTTGLPVQDIAYVYNAIVKHPSLPLIYGFSPQDYIYTLDASAMPQVKLKSQTPYSGSGPVCCVRGATVYNGKLFVAMTYGLWVFNFNSDGSLSLAGQIPNLQAYNVASTGNFLYVEHKASSQGGTGIPNGIYVFDSSGAQVNYLGSAPLTFAPSADDNFLYANEDNKSVQIYQILWSY